MTCLFDKCKNGCQGHVLSAPTPTGQLMGVSMGAGLVLYRPLTFALGWFSYEGRTWTHNTEPDYSG